jgi:hypothetical protein
MEFENKGMRKIFGPKNEEVKEANGGDAVIRSLIITTRSLNIIRVITEECDGRGISTYWGGERCIQDSGGETLREERHLEEPTLDGRIISKLT